MLDLISQIGVVVFGVVALFLIARKNKWGFIVGLCAQPFWFYLSFKSGQWGIFISTVIYTFNFLYGIKIWFKK